MNRRGFFKEIAGGETSAAPAQSALPLPAFRSEETPGRPRQYRKGERVLILKARVWLCYDSIGFYAVEAHCPHLGCLVRPLDNGFVCPCHQSRFDQTGERESGPARRGLRYFYVDLDENGCLVIHNDHLVDPNDRLIA